MNTPFEFRDLKTIYEAQAKIIELPNGNRAKICAAPFYNCQTFSIASMVNVLDYYLHNEEESEKNEFWKFLYKCVQYTGKPQICIDIYQNWHDKMLDICKDYTIEVLIDAPYINNTKSKMVMLLIKLDTNKLYEIYRAKEIKEKELELAKEKV